MTSVHLLRRGALVVLVVPLALVLGLAVIAVSLPEDGSESILALRGARGFARVLAVREEGDSSVRHLALVNEDGAELTTAWVRMPRALEPAYRVLLTYAGFGTGERILDLIPRGGDLVVVAVQYPLERPEGLIARAHVPFAGRGAVYRSLAGGMVAVDWLEGEAGLDPARIVLLGASLGSIFATIHGSLDDRIPEVLLIHGGADLPSTLERALTRRVPRWLLPAAVRLARIPSDTFDPIRYVDRIAPRRLTMIAARDDRYFPPAAVEAFIARARAPKTLRWTDTAHVGAGKADVVQAVLEELAAYFAEAGAAPGYARPTGEHATG